MPLKFNYDFHRQTHLSDLIWFQWTNTNLMIPNYTLFSVVDDDD